jgi:short-subunit dehydrogenase
MSTETLTRRGRTHPLKDRVVVITGASSGIGRATAYAYARCGARVVVAARNEAALEEVARECALRGGDALVVPTDVTDAEAMTELARRTHEEFGRIDVWINNAGVGLFGPFVNAPIEAHRRVVDINLGGAMNGAAAVLPYFLEQRSGVLITNISLGGFAPVPFAAAYTAGKYGLRGFMSALRQELATEPDIHVCSVFPAVIDTPGFDHGANVSGAQLSPGAPIFPPEKVADAMVNLAVNPRNEVTVGWPSRLARLSSGLAPGLTEQIIGMVFRHFLKSAPPGAARSGNLFAPSEGRMSPTGGWRDRSSGGGLARTLAWTGLGVGGLVLTAALLRQRESQTRFGPRRRVASKARTSLLLNPNA